jgi:hypothetical protein
LTDTNSSAHSGALPHAKHSTVCTETNFSSIEGVCGSESHLRNFGGTGVSRSSAEFVAREPDAKQRDSLMRYVPHIGGKLAAQTQRARHALQFYVEHRNIQHKAIHASKE